MQNPDVNKLTQCNKPSATNDDTTTPFLKKEEDSMMYVSPQLVKAHHTKVNPS